MVIHTHRPAIRSTQRPQLVHLTMLPQDHVGLRQSQPTSQNPESKEDQRFWEMMTWIPDGLSPHGSDLPPAYCG